MFRDPLNDLFGARLLDEHPDEWGITDRCPNPSAIGYATTITPRSISAALDLGADVVVTHHDAWSFMFEQRERVYELLRQESLTHVWAHLPLDRADFGTSAALLSEAGCAEVRKPTEGEVRIGELQEPARFRGNPFGLRLPAAGAAPESA